MKKKVGLYDPFLDTLGGGELHVLSILNVLNAHEYESFLFWDTNITKNIEEKFSLRFKNGIKFIPNIFKAKISPLRKLGILKNFDIFIYVTDGSYFFSSAKKNVIFCMVPDKKLYARHLLNRLKTRTCQFIANSRFTGNLLEQFGIKNQVLYPYIDDAFFRKKTMEKEKIILSVGRFFPHLHAKQQQTMIRAFKKFKQLNKDSSSYKLILAGGLKKEDKNYFQQLKEIVRNDSSIELKPNVPFKELLSLYERSEFYWHFTGFGIDERSHPEMVEHFGIAPLQAMSTGCIAFCYAAGGPKEFIQDGINGFLFSTEAELMEKIKSVMSAVSLKMKIKKSAQSYVKKHFSYPVFENSVKKLFLNQ